MLDQLASAERTHGGVSAGVPHEDREASIAVLVAAVGETERLKRGDVDGGEREGVSTAQRVPYEDCYVVSCGVAAIPLGRGEVGDVNDSKGRDEDSRSHGDWRSITRCTSTFLFQLPRIDAAHAQVLERDLYCCVYYSYPSSFPVAGTTQYPLEQPQRLRDESVFVFYFRAKSGSIISRPACRACAQWHQFSVTSTVVVSVYII